MMIEGKTRALSHGERMRSFLTCALIVTAGCATDNEPGPTPNDEAAASTLQRGDSGPEVQRLHDYLMRYGYFPNAELARSYPSWSAVVPHAPADLAVFDEYTEEAVFAFQRLAGLAETGVVDEPTQAMVAKPRCGYPDSAGPSNEKWARHIWKWPSPNLKYNVSTANVPGGRTTDFTNNVATAFAVWTARSGYTATKTSSTAQIYLGWGNLGLMTAGTVCYPVDSANPTDCAITFNTEPKVCTPFDNPFNCGPGGWRFGDESWPANSYDFISLAVHEIGHALGAQHSTIGEPVMYPWLNAGATKRTLFADDLQAVHSAQPGHSFVPTQPPGGNATAMIARDGDLWVISGQFDSNGGQMFRRNLDGSWTEHPFGGRAAMMAYDGSALWHINNAGKIYRQGDSWVRKGGEASFIAAGGNYIFHLSKAVTRGSRDHDIYRWNGSGWDWVPGYASDIAVVRSPMTGNMELWYTNEYGEVYSQFASGGDPARMDNVPGGACGISGGADGMIYVLGCPFNASGMPVYMWSQQLGDFNDPMSKPFGSGWVQMPGTQARDMTSISNTNAQTNARIFHIGTNGLYQSR